MYVDHILILYTTTKNTSEREIENTQIDREGENKQRIKRKRATFQG